MKYSEIAANGLWHSNPATVQLLGLCPLLAVTTNFVNGLSLGLATLFVLVMSNLTVSLCSPFISPAVRLPVYVLLIASLVTCVELAIQAFSFELHQSLGIFLPLIVTNCTILGRAESFASRHPPLAALADGMANGVGFALVLIILGAMRELIGSGEIFNNMQSFAYIQAINLAGYDGFLLVLLPPGGFIFLGLLIAVKNIIEEKREQAARQQKPLTYAKRVRVS